MGDFKESNWRHLRSIREEMLEELCQRINNEVLTLLMEEKEPSQYKKYLAASGNYHDFHYAVRECFDDWRRSTAWFRCLALRKHGLLTDERLKGFTEDIAESLRP